MNLLGLLIWSIIGYIGFVYLAAWLAIAAVWPSNRSEGQGGTGSPVLVPPPITEQPRPPESNLESKGEQAERERYERKIVAEMEKADTSKLYQAIKEQGGITPSCSDLREEYRNVPPCYRNPQGLFGDVMAEHLAAHLPELGIRSENDLLQFFADRSTQARNRRASVAAA